MDSGWAITRVTSATDAAGMAQATARDVPVGRSTITGKSSSEAKDVSTEFEAMVLQNLLDTALPKSMDKLFGGGAGGSLWRSTLLEHVGRMMAERGDLQLIGQASLDRVKDTIPTAKLPQD